MKVTSHAIFQFSFSLVKIGLYTIYMDFRLLGCPTGKKEKESEENRGNQAFRPIMERLIGKGLERSEGTSSIAQ